jgi:hypothetical protein
VRRCRETRRRCRQHRPRDRKRGEPVVRSPTDAIARRPTSTSRGSTCASCGPCSRPGARDTTAECVANQKSDARSKQQCDGCRQPRVIQLAHHPGDAAAPRGPARLLRAWHSDSRATSGRSSEAIVGVKRADLRMRSLTPGRADSEGSSRGYRSALLSTRLQRTRRGGHRNRSKQLVLIGP